MPVRNITKWLPPSGTGLVTQGGTNNLITNLGNFLTDNLGNFLVTTTTLVKPKTSSTWTKTAKNKNTWINQTVTQTAVFTLIDELANFVVDELGNNIVSGTNSVAGKNSTVWTLSGL